MAELRIELVPPPVEFMEDEIEYDRLYQMKLESLITASLQPPFPYSSFENGKFIHLKFVRPETTRDDYKRINCSVSMSMFLHTLKWLSRNLWFNSSPFVHGDLTTDNIIVSPEQLWIVDYEPGLFRPVNSDIDIFIDYMDFYKSVLSINEEYNTLLKEHVPLIKSHNLEKLNPIFDKLKNEEPLILEETIIFDKVITQLRAIGVSGGKKTNRRRSKRKSKRSNRKK